MRRSSYLHRIAEPVNGSDVVVAPARRSLSADLHPPAIVDRTSSSAAHVEARDADAGLLASRAPAPVQPPLAEMTSARGQYPPVLAEPASPASLSTTAPFRPEPRPLPSVSTFAPSRDFGVGVDSAAATPASSAATPPEADRSKRSEPSSGLAGARPLPVASNPARLRMPAETPVIAGTAPDPVAASTPAPVAVTAARAPAPRETKVGESARRESTAPENGERMSSRASPRDPGSAAVKPAAPAGPRIHIGTIEVRVSSPAPAIPRPATPPALAPARISLAPRVARGFAWRYGLVQS